jgi:signal transduction histidine kinase/ActR/RegA family two-component response regulator
MARIRHFWFSLEAKVMATVVAVLIALPALTLWMIDAQVTQQIRRDAAQAADTARDSFLRMMSVRSDELALRFRNLSENNPAFQSIVRLRDGATMRDYLTTDVLGPFQDTDLVAFVTRSGEVWGVRRQTASAAPETLASAAESLIRHAGAGPQHAFMAIGGGVYRVIALPVALPEGFAGVLVFAMHITDDVLRQIKPPSSEIVLLSGGQIVGSTFTHHEDLARDLASLLADLSHRSENLGFYLVGGDRFQPVVGSLEAGADIRYVVLSSSELRLRTIERTKLEILLASVGGIVICGAIVWFFVRRITQPLSELRESAEAVGRGDFSRRIERFSNDECGDLAQAFNGMTTNLQSSRAELERAMQQVKATQHQLIQSEKLSAVGQFVAGVAHELNNPLTSVVGFSELLQSMPADAKTHDFLDKIAKSAHRCHKIVQSLLSFARQHAPERKLVDLPLIVDEVLEIMAYDLRTSNTKIVRDFAPDVPKIMGDQHQLQQVFVNILSNARQAMEPVQRDGQMIIRIRAAGTRVTMEFQDNGPGIKPEHLARIFDPFFTTKPVGKGTGLGLSLCYGIIQEHGGTITARSEPGQGATFVIDLPAALDGTGAGTGGADPASVATPAIVGSGKTVLVVDDEAWILDLAAELLRAQGHAVETATGGEEALTLIGRRRFDVVVCDWKMPGLNGVRLYEHLEATAPETARRMLFMTGDVVSDTFQEFLRKHDLSCLSKPFSMREFTLAVTKVSAGRS